MRIWKGAAAAVLVTAMLGCEPGGGGGEVETETEVQTQAPATRQQAAASPSPAGIDAGLARDYLGNAFVSAARVHTAVIDGEFNAAQNSLNDVKRQMNLAEQHATLEQQRTLNRLEAQVIDLQGELDAQSPGAMQSSNQMVRAFFDYYQQLASTGGGAGQGLEQQPGDYPPPAQVEPEREPLRNQAPVEPRDEVGAEGPINEQMEQPFSP